MKVYCHGKLVDALPDIWGGRYGWVCSWCGKWLRLVP